MTLQSIIKNNFSKIFNASNSLKDQLYADTEALAMPEGRRVGQPGHDVARDYLIDRMDEIGLEPFAGDTFELTYQGKVYGVKKKHTFTNIVGVIPGRKRNLPPLLLGAHYDSVIDAPCADDNATSVALNLAIAKMVMEAPLERDLIIALYDAEEPPYFRSDMMGSTRFFEDYCQHIDFAGAIITDLIGHDFCVSDLIELPTVAKPLLVGTDKIVFMTGAESDGIFPEVVESVAESHKGIKIFPTLNSYIGNLSDHHAFEKNGKPFLFFSCAQGKYYHHEQDTIDWINFDKLADLTRFIHDIIYQLDETPAGKAPYALDPVDFEIDMIKKALGPTKLKLAFKALGDPIPKTREDMDKLIGWVVGF